MAYANCMRVGHINRARQAPKVRTKVTQIMDQLRQHDISIVVLIVHQDNQALIRFNGMLRRITCLQVFIYTVIAVASMQDKISLLVRCLRADTKRDRFAAVDMPTAVIEYTLEPLNLILKRPQQWIKLDAVIIGRVQKFVEVICSTRTPEQLSLLHILIVNGEVGLL